MTAQHADLWLLVWFTHAVCHALKTGQKRLITPIKTQTHKYAYQQLLLLLIKLKTFKGVHTHMHTHTCMHQRCTHTHAYTHMHAYTHTHMHTHTRTHSTFHIALPRNAVRPLSNQEQTWPHALTGNKHCALSPLSVSHRLLPQGEAPEPTPGTTLTSGCTNTST